MGQKYHAERLTAALTQLDVSNSVKEQTKNTRIPYMSRKLHLAFYNLPVTAPIVSRLVLDDKSDTRHALATVDCIPAPSRSDAPSLRYTLIPPKLTCIAGLNCLV
jgi:hypothetical protein